MSPTVDDLVQVRKDLLADPGACEFLGLDAAGRAYLRNVPDELYREHCRITIDVMSRCDKAHPSQRQAEIARRCRVPGDLAELIEAQL